jgi:hypothetical protein
MKCFSSCGQIEYFFKVRLSCTKKKKKRDKERGRELIG